MKRTETVFFWLTSVCLAVLFLLFPGSVQNALAQTCGYWMHPQYSTYSNASTDGTYIYTTVTLSGTTTGTCPYSCGSECYATHTPGVYNKIGDVGGSQGGSAEPWNYYFNVVNNKQKAATPGTEYAFWGLGQVTCSIEGTFYSTYVPTVYLRIVETTLRVTNALGNYCITQPACLPGQAPICSESEVYDAYGCGIGYDCDTLAYRTSTNQPYSCAPAAYCIKTTTLPGWCDHN